MEVVGSFGSLSNIALYGKNNMLKRPFSSLNEEFMVTHTTEVLQYPESYDPKVSQAGIPVRTGRKWKAAEAVEVAEKVESPACPLCQRGTLEHILSACSKALGEGRYLWRRAQVLKVIANTI